MFHLKKKVLALLVFSKRNVCIAFISKTYCVNNARITVLLTPLIEHYCQANNNCPDKAEEVAWHLWVWRETLELKGPNKKWRRWVSIPLPLAYHLSYTPICKGADAIKLIKIKSIPAANDISKCWENKISNVKFMPIVFFWCPYKNYSSTICIAHLSIYTRHTNRYG